MRAVVVKKLKEYRPGGTLYLKEPTAKELSRRVDFLTCKFCKNPVHKNRLTKHLTWIHNKSSEEALRLVNAIDSAMKYCYAA